MLKLVVLTQTFPVREQPYRGHSVFQTLLRLREFTDLCVISPQATYPSWLRPSSRPWSRTDLSYSPQGLATTYFSYPAVPIVTRPFNGFICARRAEALVASHKPDLILSYWIYPDGFTAVRLAHKMGIPAVVKSIGSDLNESRDPISTMLVRQTMQAADAVLTVSNELRRKAIRMGVDAEKITAIPNGCDTSVFVLRDRMQARHELEINVAAKLVLYVGRLDVKKGLRELLCAFADAIKVRADLRLILVGDGPAEHHLLQLASQLGIADNVTIVPPCSSSRIAVWMAAADVVTLPSYAEGCPNVVLEALSCGRPVVATSVGAIPDIVGPHCGMLVPVRDADRLSVALLGAVNTEWDSACIRASSTRSWEDVARETFEVCTAVVSQRNKSVRRRNPTAKEHSSSVSSRDGGFI